MSQEYQIKQYYAQFSQGHDFLRGQLMARLDEQQIETPAVATGSGFAGSSRFLMAALALAACLVIVVSAIFMVNTDSPTMNQPTVESSILAQAAWADSVGRVGQIQSIHFRLTTPGGGGRAVSLEMWWQQPDNFRMAFSNGLLLASNETSRFKLDPHTNTLKVTNAVGMGPVEMFVLGQLGRLVTSDNDQFVRDWIDDSKVTRSTDITYKGIPCRAVTCECDGWRYEYIIDNRTNANDKTPFYDVKEYGSNGVLRSHLEVIDVDQELPDSLFTVEPKENTKVLRFKM